MTNIAHEVTKIYVGKPLLPSGYTEVEYLQNDGIGYIDSGVSFSSSLKIEADFQFIEYQRGFESWVAGTWNTDGGIHIGLSHDGIPTASNGTISQTTDCFVRTTGTALQTSGYTSTTTNNIYIFTENSASKKLSSSGIIKLYSLKIYDNTTLLKSFVPCYRDLDNALGMYDTVDNTFYSPTYNIPSNYERVEYIESTGTQYIETNYVGDNTTGFYTKFNTANSLTTDVTLSGSIFGSRDNSSKLYVLQTYTSEPETMRGSLAIANQSYDAKIIPSSLIKLTHSAADALLTRTDGTSISTVEGNKGTSSKLLFAFKRWNQGSPQAYLLSSTKMYQFIFYENYNSVHEYIPVIDLQNNNKPGLYDIIGEEFLVNGDTEGDDFLVSTNEAPKFIAGPVMPSVARRVVKVYAGV